MGNDTVKHTVANVEDWHIEQPAALVAYLRAEGRIGSQEHPAIQVLGGGVSNRTVMVQRESGEAWVIKQALAQLRTASEWYSSPDRIHREALGTRWLEQILPPGRTAPLVFEDNTRHLFAMQAIPEPHENWKQTLLRGGLVQDHAAQFGRLLGQLHRRAWDRRETLQPLFADRGFFISLRVEPYYEYTASQIPAAAEQLRALADEMLGRPVTLTQGDYSPKNILLHADRLVLLDHEAIHWGDPAFDVGFAWTHLLSKGHHLARQRAQYAAAAKIAWQAYEESRAPLDEQRAVRHTAACLLARIDGRSPLEYLSASERNVQRQLALRFLADPPRTLPALIEKFFSSL